MIDGIVLVDARC